MMDSIMNLQQALTGKDVPGEIQENLAVVEVSYWSLDGREDKGFLIVHRDLAADVAAIFSEIKAAHFPIEKIIPMSHYAWSDEASMADNNSSAFNYRAIQGGQHLSQHAFGRAIDINPRLNPYVKGEITLPSGAEYSPDVPGAITIDGPVVAAFARYGWDWGGAWQSLKDWQHFEKRESSGG